MEALGGLRRCVGGLAVKSASLNLLRHPRRWHRLESEQTRAALLAFLAGLLVGCAGLVCLQWRHAQLLDQRAQLQMQSQALTRQQAQHTAAKERSRLQTQWHTRARAWQAQRALLRQLHAALAAQADSTGLRLLRWQGDGNKLVLQAWLPRAETVPQLLSQLSAAARPGWTLQSLAERPDAGVDLVLEAPWLSGAQDHKPAKP